MGTPVSLPAEPPAGWATRIHRKKVLMVGPVPPPEGGIATVMSATMDSDLSLDFTFDVFNRSAIPPEHRTCLQRSIFRLKRLFGFFLTLKKERYDFIHIHSADPHFVGTAVFMLLARVTRTKVLLHMHGTDWDMFYTRASALTKLLIRTGLFLPHMTVVLYTLWAKNLRRIRPSLNIRVVRNMIRRSAPADPVTVQQLRDSLGINTDDFVAVTVGAVGKRKGSFEILRAAHVMARRKSESVVFVLVGGEELPGEMDQLHALMRSQCVEKYIRLTGEVAREHIPQYIGIADVFLLPSFIEGLPISIIEAMQQGKPVISTPVGGIPDMIQERVSGLLIQPGVPEEIVEAVLLLRGNEHLRDKLGETGKKVFEEQFEISGAIHELRAVYRLLAVE
ncbi:MAG TPA: glycosyltransferase family 4 protein [Desulfomonilaceae bacterium]|nr:glycosyltransferase family 4 protein [Desulfomonilaceae bacterium]